MKKPSDINYIMSQYQKTGMLPGFSKKNPQFIDETTIPDFLTAFEVVTAAKELFNELPAIVRRAMDNNPANLEAFCSDPENQDFLVKHGVMEIPSVPEEKPLLTKKDIENLKGVVTPNDGASAS